MKYNTTIVVIGLIFAIGAFIYYSQKGNCTRFKVGPIETDVNC